MNRLPLRRRRYASDQRRSDGKQLGSENLIADSSLRLQLAAVPPAMRACHRTAEQARVFWGYSEVELKPAAGILTNRAVNYSRVAGRSG